MLVIPEGGESRTGALARAESAPVPLVVRLDPQFAEAYRMRGVAYGRRGDLDKAIADLTVIRLDPKRAEVYYNRGLADRKKGGKFKAEEDFMGC